MNLLRKCPNCRRFCGKDNEVCPICGTSLRNRTWYLDYYHNGTRKREAIDPNRRLAEQVLAKRKVEIIEGRYFDRQKEETCTLKEILDDFLAYSKSNKRSFGRDQELVNNILSFFDGSILAKDILPINIERYKSSRLAQRKAPATVNREMAALKRAFNIAKDNDKVIVNPVERVEMLFEDNTRTRFLSEEEMKRLLAACSPQLRPIVETALLTGMRKSEILDLRWEHVDFQRGLIYIIKSKSKKRREIPISIKLDILLKNLFNKASIHDEYVFVTARGHHKYHKIDTIFENTVRKAGIEDFTFHCLRHSCASYLVMSGIDLTTVKEILGHSDIRTTMRYAHLSQPHKQKAMDTLGSKFDGIWDGHPNGHPELEKPRVDTFWTPQEDVEEVPETKHIEFPIVGAVPKWLRERSAKPLFAGSTPARTF